MTRTTMILLALACACGCQTKERLSTANDQLRIERESLREIVQRQENEIAELRAKIAELTNASDSAPSADVIAAMPRVAAVKITRSSRIDESESGPVAVFFIRMLDGRGRFMQGVGSMTLRVQSVAREGEDPVIMGTQELDPYALREAYTSGFGGAAYMIRVPLDQPAYGSLVLTAQFADASTGVTYEDDRLVSK